MSEPVTISIGDKYTFTVTTDLDGHTVELLFDAACQALKHNRISLTDFEACYRHSVKLTEDFVNGEKEEPRSTADEYGGLIH